MKNFLNQRPIAWGWLGFPCKGKTRKRSAKLLSTPTVNGGGSIQFIHTVPGVDMQGRGSALQPDLDLKTKKEM